MNLSKRMQTLTKAQISGALVLVICCSGRASATAAELRGSGVKAVVNTVTIQGAPKAVFDLVTTARLWARWHPATKAVGGVVERPYGPGDLIHERGRVGEADFVTTWKVTEHARPRKIVLQSLQAPARITYTFKPVKGSTLFTRRLEYQVENFDASQGLEQIMRDQSEQAVKNLKALVESILKEEAKPLS